jgi:O-antigen/teichoic acid export membrane protein
MIKKKHKKGHNKKMKALIKKTGLNTKMGSDIVWNLISMVFVALSGLIYNTVFVLLYDPSTLGLFNQANVYFLLFSQIAVFGIHFSVLKYVSEFSEEKGKRDRILTSAVIGAVLISVAVALILFVAAKALNIMLDSSLIRMLFIAFPALIFFALNKVLLNFLNGIREMKAFAVFQSLRYIFIVISLLVLGFTDVNKEYLMLVYLVSEFLLFILISIYIGVKKLAKLTFDKEWFKEHIVFGSKIFLGNLVVDVNAKMDIIILGLFVSDYIVGIYSFAIIFADGFYQILVVIRRNINPLITKHYKDNIEAFHELKNSVKKKVYTFIPILAVLVLIGYYVLCMVLKKTEYLAAIVPFAIVLFGKAMNSYLIIMGNIMNQTGNPKRETLLNLITIGTNTALNFILIPFFGMIGAAVATAISFFVFSIVLLKLTKNRLDINLLTSN